MRKDTVGPRRLMLSVSPHIKMADYPDFDEALRQFQKFVAAHGAPEDIVFVTPEEVILNGRRMIVRLPYIATSLRQAREAYHQAVTQRHGVLLGGLCRVENQLCAYVYGPNCEAEAMVLMYPDGLKLKLPTPLPEGDVVKKSWKWRLLQALEGRRSDILMNKREMFK